jgi:GntR family transcriptional repressor for pyruvate dehydrogenase complex
VDVPAESERRSQLSQPRVAEMVADILRARIVDGELADGAFLPKQDDLIDEFRVSRPSIREAMRILETEGLVSVRRGNVGGAEVHAPRPDPVAHMLGLVLQSQRSTLTDLAAALRILEPACAALCAGRVDRAEHVVPALEQLNEDARAQTGDGPAFTRLARRWHDQLVGSCGNRTMILLVGALEAIWSQHERVWAEASAAAGSYPEDRLRQQVLKAHVRVTEHIAAGNAEAAHRAAARHLDETQTYLLARDPDQRVAVTSPGQPFRRS